MSGRIVVKIGSQVLCDEQGELNLAVLEQLAGQIGRLAADGWQVLMVSSGAVAAGRGVAGQKLERVPANHPLFSDESSGFNLARVTLNDPKLRQDGDRLDARRTQVAPLLEGLQVNGRYAVIFSPYDLSCALESSTSMECKGYLKADAARIGTNVILFALQR